MKEKPIKETIVWIDSSHTGGWTNKKGNVSFIETMGYLVDEDDISVTLAQSRCLNEGFVQFSNIQVIVKCCIKKRWKIKEKE